MSKQKGCKRSQGQIMVLRLCGGTGTSQTTRSMAADDGERVECTEKSYSHHLYPQIQEEVRVSKNI